MSDQRPPEQSPRAGTGPEPRPSMQRQGSGQHPHASSMTSDPLALSDRPFQLPVASLVTHPRDRRLSEQVRPQPKLPVRTDNRDQNEVPRGLPAPSRGS